MKKWIISMVAFSSLAAGVSHAQTTNPPSADPPAPTAVAVVPTAPALSPFHMRLGLNLYFGGGFGIGASVAANQIVQIADNVNLGARGRFSVSFGNPMAISGGIAPVVLFAIPSGGVYLGPSLAFATGGATAVSFGILAGVEYLVAPNIMVYGETVLDLAPFIINLAAGAEFAITNQISAYAQLNTIVANGPVAFGLGAGIGFSF